MMSNQYPPNPAQLIVLSGTSRPGSLRDTLQAYADRLTAADAFADVTARDARTVATTIVWDLLHGDESAALRDRAAIITGGWWGGWDNPSGVAYAFSTAATMLDLM